jgi:DNA-binding NtrC family response regulator
MSLQRSLLYVDDESTNLDTFRWAFGSDFQVKTCHSGEEALKILDQEEIPLVVADQRMPGMTGIELCERLFTRKPEIIRMILTAYAEVDTLLDAIRRGHVHDYILKPWKKSELKPLFDRAFEDYQQKKIKLAALERTSAQVKKLQEEIQEIYHREPIIGEDTGLKSVITTLQKAAPTDSTILLLGETGTGKELLARAIHEMSPRRSELFVPVQCAAFVQTLLESELFGHEKGAFTGADQTRVGYFEMAEGGTIFLDEVGEIPEEIQVKLLRVLQERKIQRVGGNRSIPIDVRLIGATHKNLSQAVREGRFREDLFYRLNVIAVKVPSLRERKEDIRALATHFFKKFTRRLGAALSLPEKTLEYLSHYDWPGNVRELQNIIERAVILAPGPTIDPEDLNLNLEEMLQVEKVDMKKISEVDSVRSQIQSKIQEDEVKSLTDTLKQAKGNISEAARLLGIARSTLFNRLKKYSLI